jgi:hypothetical protein
MTQEALKLALEALKAAQELAGKHDAELEYGFQQAITAIKEALAQPEQEPAAWMDADGNTFPFVWNVGVQQGSKYLDETLTPLYTYPPQRTEQEQPLPPVEIGVDVTADGASVVAFYRKPNSVMEMFYSQFHPAPQRTWVGLAAEDRLTAKYMQDAPDGIEAVIDYLEAKLKEKNT